MNEQLHQWLLNSDELYCNYCLSPQTSFHCCQENHFSKYADLYPDEQEAIREEYEL